MIGLHGGHQNAEQRALFCSRNADCLRIHNRFRAQRSVWQREQTDCARAFTTRPHRRRGCSSFRAARGRHYEFGQGAHWPSDSTALARSTKCALESLPFGTADLLPGRPDADGSVADTRRCRRAVPRETFSCAHGFRPARVVKLATRSQASPRGGEPAVSPRTLLHYPPDRPLVTARDLELAYAPIRAPL